MRSREEETETPSLRWQKIDIAPDFWSLDTIAIVDCARKIYLSFNRAWKNCENLPPTKSVIVLDVF